MQSLSELELDLKTKTEASVKAIAGDTSASLQEYMAAVGILRALQNLVKRSAVEGGNGQNQVANK